MTFEQRNRVKAKFDEVMAEKQKEAKTAGKFLRYEARLAIHQKVYDFIHKEVLTDKQRAEWKAKLQQSQSSSPKAQLQGSP